MPGGNTRASIHVDPFPLTMARGEGARLWDLDGHEYADFLSEFTAGIYGHSHPAIRRAIEEALAGGLNFGAQSAGRGAVCRGALRPVPVDRPGAVHQFRHRGQFDGGQRRPRDHRPAQNPGLWRRLSWRRVLFPRPWQRGERAVRLSDRPLQRHDSGRRPGPPPSRRARRDPGRADAGDDRLHPGRACLSRRVARARRRDRGGADL